MVVAPAETRNMHTSKKIKILFAKTCLTFSNETSEAEGESLLSELTENEKIKVSSMLIAENTNITVVFS
jgi:hypothetical protein